MNFRVSVIRGENLRGVDGREIPNAFVQVLQNTHEQIQVGCTKAVRDTRDPVWDHTFNVHGIRGLKFEFVVFDWIDGNYKPTGAVTWILGSDNLNEETWLRISHESRILVKIEELSDAKPVTAPNARQPLQKDMVLYANLAFAPGCGPLRRVCPLDLSLIAFSRIGAISELSLNCKRTISHKCVHSGEILCRCYDTYGPSIRIDLTSLFGGLDPVQAVVIAVTSNESSKSLSDYEWIAVDFYTTGETICKRTREGCLNVMDERLQLPHFYRRVPLSVIPGSTACVVGVMFYDHKGLSFQNVVWNAPSQVCNLKPLTICEVAPELSALAGFPCNPRAQRRFSAFNGIPVSISRCLSSLGIRGIVPVSVIATWEGDCEMNLSAIAMDKHFKRATAVYFGKLSAFHGAITHSGDPEVRNNKEEVSVNLTQLPSDVHYICMSVHLPNQEGLVSLGRCVVQLVAHGSCEVFYHEFKKKLAMNGALVLILQKNKEDWNIIPHCIPTEHSEISGMRVFLTNILQDL